MDPPNKDVSCSLHPLSDETFSEFKDYTISAQQLLQLLRIPEEGNERSWLFSIKERHYQIKQCNVDSLHYLETLDPDAKVVFRYYEDFAHTLATSFFSAVVPVLVGFTKGVKDLLNDKAYKGSILARLSSPVSEEFPIGHWDKHPYIINNFEILLMKELRENRK